MTTDTTDTPVDMNAVVKIGKIGNVVNPHPLDRATAAPAFTYRSQFFTLRFDKSMTVHAGLGWRNAGDCGPFDVDMAIAAINAKVAGMKLMAVGHWLLRSITNVSI